MKGYRMAAKMYKFNLDKPDEMAAGIRGYFDTIYMILDSGFPGGEPGEFEAFMMAALAEWFDGAKIQQIT